MSANRRLTFAAVLFGMALIAIGDAYSVAFGQQAGAVLMGADHIVSLAYSPDGKFLAGGGVEEKVRLWDTSNNKLVRTLEGPTRTVRSVAFSPDGKTIAAGSDDATVYLWATASGKLRHEFKGHSGLVESLAFAPDGRILAAGSTANVDNKGSKRNCEIRFWDPEAGVVRQTISEEGNRLASLAIAPDSKTLATAHVGKAGVSFRGVKLWDMATGKPLREIAYDSGFPLMATFSPDGKLLAVAGGDSIPDGSSSRLVGDVRLWDVEKGRLLHTMSAENNGYYHCAVFSHDGKTLTTGNAGPEKDYLLGNLRARKTVSEIKRWEVATGKLLWNVEGDLGDVRAIALSPDGASLASCDAQNVKVCDADTGFVREVLMTFTFKPVQAAKQ